MRPALIFLALLPLAACAPPGYHYDGFTLLDDAGQARQDAKRQARWDAQNDAQLAEAQKRLAPWYASLPTPQPGTLSAEDFARAQNQMYVDKLYWSIGQVPPELYP
jgi:hypothetical protein